MTHRLLLLAACAALSACAASAPPPPSTTSGPVAEGDRLLPAVTLAPAWRAIAVMERRDSITVTLATGARQSQVLAQRARFSVEMAQDRVRIRLDSIAVTPVSGPGVGEVIGVTWSAPVRSGRIGNLVPNRHTPIVDDLTPALQAVFPLLPAEGVRPGMTWVDTTSGKRRVQAFEVGDQRTSEWRTSPRTNRNGMPVQPVTVTEHFEQMGEATPGGQRMTMTAQGERSSTYYITVAGRLQGVVHRDSVAMLISIPSRRETIPTMQRISTIVRFLPVE